jgi:hypothetical protein
MSCVQRRASLLLVCIVMGAGCSSEATTATTSVTTTAAAPKPQPKPAPALSPNVPQTPEAAVQVVFDGLKASKPIVVWDALPPNSQHNVENTIRHYASQIDSEVWNSSVANLKKLATLLETKKEFILASPLWKTGQLPKLDDVKASWDPAVKLLRTVVDSELVDQQKMKAFDARKFLEGSGAKVFAELRALTKTMKSDPLAIIDTAKVSVKRQPNSNSAARVTLQGPDPNAKPIEFGIAIMDNQWTNQQMMMAANFGGVIVGSYFEPFRPYQLVEWKSDYLKDMKRLGTILDQLQVAKTSDDFQAVMGAQGLPFALQKIAQFRAKRPKVAPLQVQSWDRKAGTSMVVIKGIHTYAEPTYKDLTESVRATSPDTFRGPLEVDGMTLLFSGPGSTFDGVVKSIKVGKIVSTDKLRDTVTVELATSLKEQNSTAEASHKSK